MRECWRLWRIFAMYTLKYAGFFFCSTQAADGERVRCRILTIECFMPQNQTLRSWRAHQQLVYSYRPVSTARIRYCQSQSEALPSLANSFDEAAGMVSNMTSKKTISSTSSTSKNMSFITAAGRNGGIHACRGPLVLKFPWALSKSMTKFTRCIIHQGTPQLPESPSGGSSASVRRTLEDFSGYRKKRRGFDVDAYAVTGPSLL